MDSQGSMKPSVKEGESNFYAEEKAKGAKGKI